MLRYLVMLVAAAAFAEDTAYKDAITKWRQQQEAALKADGGWLTVTGLVWLEEGENRIPNAPGVFVLREGKTVFRADPGGSVPTTEMGPTASINAAI